MCSPCPTPPLREMGIPQRTRLPYLAMQSSLQWAGFTPGGVVLPRGYSTVDWDTAQRKFRLVWANPDVHINGVPTIGRGKESPCVFGMGREGDRYVYSVLNLSDGKRDLRRIDLGASDDVLDQGNNHAIPPMARSSMVAKRKWFACTAHDGRPTSLATCDLREDAEPSPGAYSSKAADGLTGNAQECRWTDRR